MFFLEQINGDGDGDGDGDKTIQISGPDWAMVSNSLITNFKAVFELTTLEITSTT